MLTQPARRPLGALKGILRHARQQRPMPPLFPRTMATETTPTASSEPTSEISPPPPPPPELTPIPIRPKPYLHAKKNRNPEAISNMSFAVYPGLPSSRATTPAALEAYHAQQIRRLDPKGLRTALFSRKNRDAVKPGDVLQVTTRRGEPFSGVCMSIRRAGVDSAVLLRNHLTKLGVEMWYKIYSPNVLGIEIVWRRPKRARRARLTYLRQPKHDMGNVDHLVANWRRTRNVFSTKGRPGKGGVVAGGAKAGAKGGKK